jgi:membrane-bound ClpP family serine protease
VWEDRAAVALLRRNYTRLAIVSLALSATLAVGGPVWLGDARAQRDDGFAFSFALKGGIDRSAQVVLERGLEEARAKGASVVIVRLDTPGGAVSVTREMSQAMVASPLPVIVFVNPEGARAASAGLVLTLSGDVAAMTPGTNIGSATPYTLARPRNQDERRLFEILERKARNDLIAFTRGLAQRHNRNADLAGRMISEAVNVPSAEARSQGLVDVVADNERSLLRKLDGFQVKGAKTRTLRTAGLSIRRATLVDQPTDSGESGDKTSLVSVALIFAGVIGVPLAIGMAIFTLLRGQGLWRRRRWLWRKWQADRRQRRPRDS